MSEHILSVHDLDVNEGQIPREDWFESSDTLHHLRKNKKFPTIWCAGCGIGVVMGSLIRAIESLGLENDQVALVAGIGCTARMPVYMDYNTLHTTHGRALAFATGLKIARPDMKVIAIMGDGDALAIGGNHFIHAARRNIGITALVVNNSIYGMTGGQQSPTTPLDMRATTAPYGNIEPPFPVCDLAIAAGATYVARSTVYHPLELDKHLAQAPSGQRDGLFIDAGGAILAGRDFQLNGPPRRTGQPINLFQQLVRAAPQGDKGEVHPVQPRQTCLGGQLGIEHQLAG